MDNNTGSKDFVKFKADDVEYAQTHLISASSLLLALHTQYAYEGVLSSGAMLHIVTLVDAVIGRLGLADMDVSQMRMEL